MANRERSGFIHSRAERKKKAKTISFYVHPKKKISVFDRDALVKFLLLEEIAQFYEYCLKQDGAEPENRECHLKELTETVRICNTAVEVADLAILRGECRAVRKAISERKLLRESGLAALREELLTVMKKIASTDAQVFKELMDKVRETEYDVSEEKVKGGERV